MVIIPSPLISVNILAPILYIIVYTNALFIHNTKHILHLIIKSQFLLTAMWLNRHVDLLFMYHNKKSIIETGEGFTVAGELLMNISNDERERTIFRNRRIALADQESNMITALRVAGTEEYEIWHGIIADKNAAIADADLLRMF